MPNGSEQVHIINGETYNDTKDQVSLSEDSNYLFNSINKHQYFSAEFEQITLQEKKERLIEGEIRANRSGMFKISYYEPLNEIMFSDGKDFFRFDPELEQLYIQPLEELVEEIDHLHEYLQDPKHRSSSFQELMAFLENIKKAVKIHVVSVKEIE